MTSQALTTNDTVACWKQKNATGVPLGRGSKATDNDASEAAVYAGTRGEAGKAVVEHGGAGAAPRRREPVEPGARAHED